jgi:hypothetical protein
MASSRSRPIRCAGEDIEAQATLKRKWKSLRCGTSGTVGTYGVQDQEDVPDFVNDIDNNPSVPKDIAGLVEIICHVG